MLYAMGQNPSSAVQDLAVFAGSSCRRRNEDVSFCIGGVGLRRGDKVVGQQVVRITRVEVVQRIKRLRSEFQRLAFGDPGHFRQREVQVP